MTFDHFTTSKKPALIRMPVGAGLMVVLMALGFQLEAKRVLVITMRQLVRNQIADDFSALTQLKSHGIVPADLDTPKVKEVLDEMTSDAQWRDVLAYDVVVATPTSVSPSIPGIIAAPRDAFDLIIFDEVQTFAANSWLAIAEHFSESRQVFLTSTPFSHNDWEAEAELVYRYVSTHNTGQ